jgi:hypothetical protein
MVRQSYPNFGVAPRSALQFVLWFGVVNLFADMAYEGARSVTGPFLAILGANGLIVGAVTGFGEFVGHAFRLVSGSWADRSRLYWPITIVGYVIQMVSVPLLALTGTWPHAAVPILLERAGRATRTPPRDVMLAQAGESMGRGWAFGINEALDQLGALAGPLAIAGILARLRDFKAAFALLGVPAPSRFSWYLAPAHAFPMQAASNAKLRGRGSATIRGNFGSIALAGHWSDSVLPAIP